MTSADNRADLVSAAHAAGRHQGVITAREFAVALRAWAVDPAAALPAARLVRRTDANDRVDLRGLRCSRTLDLSNYYFETPVDLRDSRIDAPVIIRKAWLEGALRLGGSRIEGTLDLRGASFEQPELAAKSAVPPLEDDLTGVLLDLDHARVIGDLRIDTVTVAGALSLNNIQVEGDVFLDDLRVEGEIDARDATVAGGIFLVRVSAAQLCIDRAKVRGLVRFRDLEVRDNLSLRSLEAGEVEGTGFDVGGALDLLAATIRKFVWLSPHRKRASRVGMGAMAYGLAVGNAFNLTGTTIGDDLDLRNARLGELIVRPDVIQVAEGRFAFANVGIGRLRAAGMTVAGNVELIARCGAVDVSNAVVKGQLTLANRGARDTVLEHAVKNQQYREFTAKPGPKNTEGECSTATSASRVIMRLLTCDGDADLAGVELRGAEPPVQPALDASGAGIKGKLLLCTEVTASHAGAAQPPAACLRAGNGSVFLNSVTLGQLSVSGDSFSDEAGEGRPGASWRWVRTGETMVGVIGLAALAGFVLASFGILASLFGGADSGEAPGWPAWKHVIVAGILAFLAASCLLEIRRVDRLTRRQRDPSQPDGREEPMSPADAARHHILSLHGVSASALTEAWLQALVRIWIAAAAVALISAPFLDADGAQRVAVWLPVLALTVLLLRGYVRVFLAVCHARNCAAACSHRAAAAPRPGPAAAVAGLVTRAAAAPLALDAWFLLLVALAGYLASSGVPPWFTAHPAWGLATLAAAPLLILFSRECERALAPVVQRVQGALAARPGDREQAPAAPPAPVASRDADADKDTRRGVAGLSLSVLAFRDVMQIATWNVLRPAQYQPRRPDLNLDRATIGDLDIVKPIPRYIGISNLAVERWRIDSEDEGLNTLDVLDHAAEFKADIYQHVEDTLRNGGQRAKADVVHRAMQRQARWRETRGLPTALALGHSLIGYGTHRAPLLRLMLVWFLFSATWFAAEYETVFMPGSAYAMEALQVGDCRLENPDTAVSECEELEKSARVPLQPLDTRARIARGLALAIRYHVPIIGWDMAPYAQPASYLVWAYTGFVTAVHWIIWPLLLASLVPALMPRGGKGD